MRDKSLYIPAACNAPNINTSFKSFVDSSSDLIVDWDAALAIFDYGIFDRLGVGSGSAASGQDLSEHPVMIVEPVYASKADKETWAQILFEQYNCPGVFLSRGGVLALYANARLTGMAVDVGAGGVTITPVQEGYPLMAGASRAEAGRRALGGNALDGELLQHLESHGNAIRPWYPGHSAGSSSSSSMPASVSSYYTQAVVRQVKEAVCQVHESPFDMTANANVPNVEYSLPDGTRLQVGPERFGVPELMFDPSSVSEQYLGYVGLHTAVVGAAMACDPDVRRDLVANMVLTGGGSAMAGLLERLSKEISACAPTGTKPRVAAASPSERAFGPWIGGSILASLGTFPDLWFSAEEYKEHGAKMLHRKVV